MAMYEWSDWTQEEFAERMLGYQAPENLDSIPRKHFDNAAPSHIDFREEGKVTPVKNQGQCGSCWAFSATNSGSQRVSRSESSLESAMAQVGYSISVAIHVGSSFQHYSGGIFSDPQCQYGQLNHGVLAVGYDHGSNWIVKNSWGGSWGEGGYIRMKQ